MQPGLFDDEPPPPRKLTASNAREAEQAHRETAPYIPHSKTSREAAKSIEPALGHLQLAVLEFLAGRAEHGAIDEEIQDGLPMHPNTETPRRIELVKKGLVCEAEDAAGEKITRRTKSNRRATVWITTAKAAQHAKRPTTQPVLEERAGTPPA